MNTFPLRKNAARLLCACSLLATTSAVMAKDYEMAVIPKVRAPWFNRMDVGIQKADKDFGVKSNMQAPASPDEAEQVRLIQDAISRKVDAILVIPNNAQSLEPVFAQAKAAGIVVITHESPNQKNADYDVEMINNEKFGEYAGAQLAEKMGGKGDFVLYVGSLTVPAHNLWADAALKEIKAKYPDMKQVADRFPVSEDQNAARQKTLDLFRTYPNLKGILAFGSQGGPGASQALREQKIKGVTIIGNTSPNQGGQYLDDGTMAEAVLWDPAEAGYAMVWLAKQALEKKAVTKDADIPTLGKVVSMEGNTLVYDRPLTVTKANRKQYGF